MVANTYWFDVAVNATNKLTCMQMMGYRVGTSLEQSGKSASGLIHPIRSVQSGEDVYVRGVALGGAPDTSFTTIVYALGG
jgi:hypothetical protein